jgi:hypothetical protein
MHMKTKYLVGYSFGEGSGGHVFVWANSPAEIEAKYPELKVRSGDAPEWIRLMPDVLERMNQHLTFDIDDPLTGVLETIVRGR